MLNNSKCEICNCDEQEVLITHHIDGNRDNNDINNLMTLCSNCHIKIHKRKFNNKDNLKIDLKSLIFDNNRLQEEIYNLKERDKKVAEYLKSQGLV